MPRPVLTTLDALDGSETVRVGKGGRPFLAPIALLKGKDGTNGKDGTSGKDGKDGAQGATGPDRLKIARTFTSDTSGQATIANVPASATVLIISIRTDAVVQKSVTRSGSTVTVAFRQVNTGTLSGVLSSFFSTVGAVTFDFLAIDPTS